MLSQHLSADPRPLFLASSVSQHVAQQQQSAEAHPLAGPASDDDRIRQLEARMDKVESRNASTLMQVSNATHGLPEAVTKL